MKHLHGMTAHPLYKLWAGMRQRCYNPNNNKYHLYGGRGVRICKRWDDFEIFVADMGERPPGTSLDRWPNKDGDYEPSNCRWATSLEQNLNRRINKNNTSGVVGVYWLKAAQQWRAMIMLDGKSVHLGVFEAKENAIKARLAGEQKYFKHGVLV